MNRGRQAATGYGERRIGTGLALGVILWALTLLVGAFLIRSSAPASGGKASAVPAGGTFPTIVVAGSRQQR